ncbi:MAG: enoyl-CoA hydratase/isomerase family protein [Reyranellaceae bacterium]
MDFQIEKLEEGAVFRLTRPAKLNAITKAILTGLSDCIDALERERARFLVVTGEGERAFCAGTDLGESAGLSEPDRVAKNDGARALFVRLSQSPLLSVAAVNGLAYGGGLELAMACTLRLAAPHAKFSLPEVKLGVLPAYGGTQFLPALVGKARALEMMLTGEPVDAREALVMGLVNRIAAADTPLLDQAVAYARSVTRFSPVAIAGIRRAVDAAGDSVTQEGLLAEQREMAIALASEDAKEGVAAFLEKRAAKFKGR